VNERTWSAAVLVAGVAGIAYLFAKSRRDGVVTRDDVDDAKDISHELLAAQFLASGGYAQSPIMPSLLAAEPPPVFAGDVHVDALELVGGGALQTIVASPTSSAVEVTITDPPSSSTVTTQDLAPPPSLLSVPPDASPLQKSTGAKFNNKAKLADRGPDSRAIPVRLELANYASAPWKGTLSLLFSESGYPDNVTRTERIDSSLEIPALEIIEAKFTYGLVAQHRNPAAWSTPATKAIAVRVEVRIDDKPLGVHEFFAR
jgi:hypothetical protein